MATPAGFEPAAPDLEGRCSIQLSYGVVLYRFTRVAPPWKAAHLLCRIPNMLGIE